MKTSNKIAGLAVLAAFGTAADHAHASGFQLIEQNSSGLGNAYSGQAAAAENASTIYFNPAGMALLPGAQVSFGLSGIRPSAKFENTTSVMPPGFPLGTNGGDAGDWAYLPAAYFSWQINPRFWAGLGISSPFGLKTDYDAGWIGRFQSQKTELKTYDINPSIAFKFNDSVSLGAGLSYQHAQFKLDRSTFGGAGIELPSSFDLSDSQWGWNLGAMFTPAPGTRLGLSYRSSMGYHLSGTVQVVGAAGFPTTASANVRMPSTTSLGLSQKLSDQWQLLADVTYTRWSSIKAVPLVLASGAIADTFNFQFRDGWRVGIGTNFKWTQNFTLKLGVAYDRSPVSDPSRLTALPDNDRTWLSFGAQWVVSKNGTLDYGYAHLFVRDGSINQLRNTAPLGFQGNVVGNYKDKVDILGISYSHAF